MVVATTATTAGTVVSRRAHRRPGNLDITLKRSPGDRTARGLVGGNTRRTVPGGGEREFVVAALPEVLSRWVIEDTHLATLRQKRVTWSRATS